MNLMNRTIIEDPSLLSEVLPTRKLEKEQPSSALKGTDIKILSDSRFRGSLGEDDELALQTEVDILSQLDHPNVVKLYEIFDEKDVMYLVLELMTGGEVCIILRYSTIPQLFDRIVEKEHYSELEAAETIRPVIDAIRYCHSMGIIHRDLKVKLS